MLQQVNIEDELKKSYLEYSLSVIIGRAIPDVRDGLKPVHRRILYAMHDLGNTYNRAYKKSARIVGDVIGKYHPHGDSAVYDALVRMAQTFSMQAPLVDGQGNFGSIDGDAAAAMRYTEVRMARITSEFLSDIEKETVNFRANYDNTLQEPVVLPTRVPNLLVNGASGIAVGMATNIPPHNLGEIVDGTLYLLDHPETSIESLLDFVKGPDFPTGAFIYGREGMREAYFNGRGSIKIRSRLMVEERARGMESIVVTEIPYALNKSNLVEKIAALVNERKIEGISDLRDESDRKGIRIVMDLKKGVLPDIIINKLYKYTALETSFGINMMAVVHNRPQLLNLKQVLEYFLEHRKEVVLRRSRYELNKAQQRAHILEGLRIALDNIDEVVRLIRASKTPVEAKQALMERFELSEVQSQAILDMRLQRLTNLEREKLMEEYRELLKRIEYLTSILENNEVLKSVIREELQEVKKTYSVPRRSEIMEQDPNTINPEDIIPDEDVVITLSRKGYIKRALLSNYTQQKRGGKGISGVQTNPEDFITTILTTTNHQHLALFTNKGKMYLLKVYEVPEGSRVAKGTHIANLLPLESDEWVATAMTLRDLTVAEEYFFFLTKKGMVKRTLISLYQNCRSSGLIALNLRDDDELITVRVVKSDSEVILVTRMGYGIRFSCQDVRPMGRSTTGVKGIALRRKDQVVSGVVANGGFRNELLTVSEKGFGKRTDLDLYRTQTRGGKGIINMKVTDKTGPVLGAMMVNAEDEIILLTSGNKIIRIGVNGISIVGRATQGVRLVRLDPGGQVVCFDLVYLEEGE
ncbi:MAG: DNA gyrase subunit A [Desulfovibrionales bacterium]